MYRKICHEIVKYINRLEGSKCDKSVKNFYTSKSKSKCKESVFNQRLFGTFILKYILQMQCKLIYIYFFLGANFS